MSRSLTLNELAVETGRDVAELRHLAAIGVIRPDPAGSFDAGDIIRIDAVASLLEAGVTYEQIAEALELGLFTFEYLHRFHPAPPPRSGETLHDAAVSLGIDGSVLSSIYLAFGLPEPAPDHQLRADEASIIRQFVELWRRGGSDALLRAARLVGEPARLLSEGWTRLYVETISEPLAAARMPMEDRVPIIVETTELAAQLAPEMFVWLLHKHLRHSIDRANIEGFEQSLVERGLAPPAPVRLPAIAFVDISGYTSMTELRGDAHAVHTADLLRERALRIGRRFGGSVVKLLGDGVMMHFPYAAEAVAGVVELVTELTGAGLPAHAGIHSGPVVEHDGDYYGRTVNVASRIADRAEPATVLVTEVVVDAAGGSGVEFSRVGAAELKGIDQPMAVYRATSGR